MRTVTFGSRTGRITWALIGAAALVGGYLVISPSFRSTPAAPHPWGLWIGTDSTYLGKRAGTLLSLHIDSSDGCGKPVEISGELQWGLSGHFAGHHRPTRLALGIAGTSVLKAEVKAPGRGNWTPMQSTRHRGAYVLSADLAPWHRLGEQIDFRLNLDVSRAAGFEACYLTSPALFEFNGYEPVWNRAAGAASVVLYRTRKKSRPSIHELPLDDAIVWMSMADRDPDRAALDAHAEIRRDRVLLGCTERLPDPGTRFADDPFFYERRLLEESSCGSVQRFESPAAEDDLSLRLFLAGILVSAGVAMLLEAVVSGRTREA